MEGYWLRGIRGAISVEEDIKDGVIAATEELLVAMLEANDLDDYEAIAAIFFTSLSLIHI